MHSRRMQESARRWTLGGLAVGLLAGTTLFASSVGGAASRADDRAGLVDVLHSPPLLVERGRPVQLRFDAVCGADERGAPCPVTGRLYVRSASQQTYQGIPLASDGDSGLTATLSPDVGADGSIAYYAEIADGVGGETTTVPAGGAAAPLRTWFPSEMASVDLGTHVFAHVRGADGVVLKGRWGSGPGAFGLITGPEQATIGPSAFDVGPDGSIVVLDQVNRRLAFVKPGGGLGCVAIKFAGAEGDLAIDGQGSIFVLDHGAAAAVHRFTLAGAPTGDGGVSGRGPDMLRAGATGIFAHGYPGDTWIPVSRGGELVDAGQQAAGARIGLDVGGGTDVIVRGRGNEALFALVRADRIVHAWRVSSATNLGEIQLAQPYGNGLLVVVRVWTDAQAEFVALVLSPAGVEHSFSMPAGEWAESAPLSRFRLHGSSLYQLRSTPDGVEIVTYDLGGAK
jgi:hypothetical protein